MGQFVKDCSLWFVLEGSKSTVGDLRTLVSELDKIKVPDDYELTDCIVSFCYQGTPELIIDGESSPHDEKCNILLEMKFDSDAKS
jgi:hypothetical protein